MGRKYDDLIICPVCGKSFIPAALHSYKISREGKLFLVCSYTCERREKKNHPSEREEKERLRILKELKGN